MFIALGGAAILVLMAVAFFVSRGRAPQPAAMPAVRPKPVTAQPVATTPVAPVKNTAAAPAPSSTANSLAHVPVKAINKAQTTTAAQAAATDATNEVLASETPVPAAHGTATATPNAAPAPAAATTVTELAPGVSATVAAEASTTASAAFRTFVANLSVKGVVGGSSPKALINGRLIRVGDVVDSNLGITFAGVSDNQLVFKDHSGATVMRRY